MFVALHALGGWWDVEKAAPHVLARAAGPDLRPSLLAQLTADIEFEGHPASVFGALHDAAAAQSLRCDNPLLAPTCKSEAEAARPNDASSSEAPPWSGPREPEEAPVDWGAVLGSGDPRIAEGLDAITTAFLAAEPRWRDWDELCRRMRGSVAADNRAAHLRALAAADGLGTSQVVDALKAARAGWSASPAAKDAVAVRARAMVSARA